MRRLIYLFLTLFIASCSGGGDGGDGGSGGGGGGGGGPTPQPPGKATLTAPLSGRKCVRYEVVVEKKGNKNSWTTIIDDADQTDYYIEDETGKAQIQLNDHIIHLVEDKEYNSGFLYDATEHLEEYLTSHGVKSEYWLGINKTLRYKEAIIALNERVAVLGEGNWIKSENNEKLLEIIESAQTKVYLTDDPKLF